jgi:hypothetical protein
VVDTVPVSDRGWDRGEDAMVVPSRVSTPVEPVGSGTPRAADAEMVAGRPVYVVYRPSRGLEVRDSSQPRRLPLREGPTDPDRLVR